jgi:hypothetical protein
MRKVYDLGAPTEADHLTLRWRQTARLGVVRFVLTRGQS